MYFVTVGARLALTLAHNVIAAGFVVAVAGLRAVVAPETLRASIRADRTLYDKYYIDKIYFKIRDTLRIRSHKNLAYRPAGCTVAFAGHGVAGSTVLTTTLRFAFLAMLAHRAQVVASA